MSEIRDNIRGEFPACQLQVHGKPLIYFDNAATTQKPDCVLDAVQYYYKRGNANIHRGVHYLSQLATEKHEQARSTVAEFLNAPCTEEIIFTSGCTMAINMVAAILGTSGRIREGDEIITCVAEHHSNIVPWQMMCQRTDAKLLPVPLLPDNTLDMTAYQALLSPRTRVVTMAHVSNALGVIHPVQEITRLAKANSPDTLVLIDGAQATPHLPINVQSIGCDFYAFSGHKMYAPTGIGALWGKRELLEALPPWMGGGEMIDKVSFDHTTYNHLPFKYEAGTPNISGAIGLAEAISFMQRLGVEALAQREHALIANFMAQISAIDGMKLFAPTAAHAGAVSFNVDGIHPYDLGCLLDQMGIAVRTGHHCCQPLMDSLGISGTVRASFAVYNTHAEIAMFIDAMHMAIKMLR